MNAITEKSALTPAATGTQAEPPAPRSRKRLLAIPAGVIIILGAVVIGHWWFAEGRWIESTDNAYVQGHITVLSPRIDGDVAAVPVADNQRVHAGDPLVLLDPADWKARLDQAEASLAEARAAVTTLEAQVAQQRTNLLTMAANRATAEAELTRSRQDADRSNALRVQGWTSQQANDLAVTESRKATSMLTAAIAQEAAARDQVTVLTAQLHQAEARLQGAEAQAALAKNNLEHTVIRAPFDGIVGNRAAEPGKHVVPGTQLLALAPPPEQLFVVANFKETQLHAMAAGQKVRLIPDIDPDAAVDGTVDSLAPATGALFSLLPPENATGNFTKVVQRVPVKLALDPEQAKKAAWLRAGLSVTAEVDTRGPNAVRDGLWGSMTGWFRR
jgi:membrane fusion protein, multidrug efflux system